MNGPDFGAHGITQDGRPLVTHTFCCPFWIAQNGDGLCPIRECWYCKYADFRRSTKTVLEHSPCNHPCNRVPPHPAPNPGTGGAE
ncbi:MAG: hypothetical protein RRY53_04050 [Pseudoflavonifractor sp.]